MLSKALRNTFVACVYLLCLWSILATSQMQKSIDYSSSLDATSDCVNPVLQLTVATANGIITSPGSTSWTDFGFPSNQVFLNSDYSGTVNGLSRACTRTYGDTISSDQWIYSCFDNGAYACSILIQQN